jgi:hypothetical protein
MQILKQITYGCLFTMALVCCTCTGALAQKDTGTTAKAATILNRLDDKMLSSLQRRYTKLENKLRKANEKAVKGFQLKEQALYKKISQKDSTLSNSVSAGNADKYNAVLKKIQDPVNTGNAGGLNNYLPGLDSLQTTFRFLEKTGGSIPGIPAEKLKQIQDITGKLKGLQTQVNLSGEVTKLLKEQKQLLKAQLEKLGMGNALKTVSKQAYYYQQQVNEYKEMINDPEKLGKKLLGIVRDAPAFKEFMAKNSMLAQLFPMPSGYGTPAALQGLQTRSSVQQQLTQQLGGGAGAQQQLQQQIQQAQSQLNGLKDKVAKLGGSSSEMNMPDFKPNNQKTKTFWKRIEYGVNIQSQKTNAWLPVTTDIAFTAGYKLNDKATVGLGAGGKIGWGNSISHLKITGQGISLRSYIDLKIKGGIWISGGYEENYQQEFSRIDDLKKVNAWQHSGLIGVTKKYKVGKKTGNLQLLWDFLSYQQLPRTQPLKFRIGYRL